MHKIFKFIIGFLIVGLLAGVGTYAFMFNHRRGPNPGQEAGRNLYIVVAGNISSKLRLSGRANFLVSENIAFTTNAHVKEKLVNDGDSVEKGQVILRLNEEDLIYELENARGKYLSAKAHLDEIENWQNSSNYISSKNQLANVLTRCKDSERKYKENQDLLQAKAISKQDLDTSEYDLKLARSDLDVAKASFKETAAKGEEKAQEEARSAFTVAEIDFRKAKEATAHKEIIAPISGVITIRQKSPDNSADSLEKLLSKNSSVSASDIILTISDQSIFTVDVQVDEFDVYRVKENQPCKITIPALPGKEFTGHVVSISATSSETSRAVYQVRCQLDQLNPPVRLGMSGNVEILLAEKKNILVVPTSALVKKGTTTGVYLAGSGSDRFCPVSVGLNNGDMAEIAEGLSAGQKILSIVPAKLLNSESNGV
jgi:HlyD family secretion protein